MTTLLLIIVATAAIAAAIYFASKASDAKAENARLRERVTLTEEHAREQAADNEIKFKNLAAGILAENSRQLRELNDQRMAEIIAPLKENIAQFKQTVTDTYANESRERFSLQQRIRELIEINNTIGREARELSLALRGNNQVQGDWGELMLESILAKSGLRRGHEFDIQVTTAPDGSPLKSADGKPLRPDAVVYYPDGRCVVIDSKVSLGAYIDLVNAETPEARAATRLHLQAVKRQIAELRGKSYHELVGRRSTDFTMMFIPNEGAYISAMQADSHLWQEAYDSRVLIVSPTHLISALKLIEQLWQNDLITRNVIDIAVEGGNMYDKFVGFVDDMARIDKALDNAKASYQAAIGKLSTGRGNLVTRAEKLRKLGAKASKQLPPTLTEADLQNSDE